MSNNNIPLTALGRNITVGGFGVNTTEPEPETDSYVLHSSFIKLGKAHDELQTSHNQLWDAYKALIVEHRALMDRVDEITKALTGGSKKNEGPVVNTAGQYRPTGYFEET